MIQLRPQPVVVRLGRGVSRVILLGAVGALSLLPKAAAAESKSEVYARDVEFLLAELEKKAGHFFKLKGVDWAAVSKQFREEAGSITNDAGHVKLCRRLVARVRDGHAGLLDVKAPVPDESQGRRWTGPRVHLLAIADKVYVRQAFGPAARQGIEVGSEVVRIDGTPARDWLTRRVTEMRDETGYSTDHQALYAACHWGLAGWEGTKVQFDLRKRGESKTIAVTRQGGPNFVPIGPIFPPKGVQESGRQSYGKTAASFGYIHLRDVPQNLPEQLDTMLEAIGDVPGLILDMRANGGGGGDHAAMFCRFIGAGHEWHGYRGAGRKPYAGPMVLIVDSGTRSAGETFGGLFKEEGRAYVIGDGPTAGTSSQKEQLTVPSGLFSVQVSVASNMRRFNGGRGIEGIGVAPHELVPYDPAELVRGVDTQIRRAEELLKQGLPAEQVPFRPGS
jgi:carboxyl-terminal processing protease